MTKLRLVAVAFGGLMLTGLLCWSGLADIGQKALVALWAIPFVAMLHLVQHAVCGGAWRALLEPPRPSRWCFFRMRWIRAAVAALMPVSGIGAAVVGVRLLTLNDVRVDLAGASVTLDLTMELIAQIAFAALGLCLLPGTSLNSHTSVLIAFGLAVAMLAAMAFIAVQRGGGVRLVETGLAGLARRWPALTPLAEARLHDSLARLHRNRRALLTSGLLHFGAWLLGAAEVWLVLLAMGHPTAAQDCVVIESLGLAIRNMGFFVPAALGVQEGGFILAGSLVGLAPDTAIVLSMAKRLRDVVVGAPGLVAWHWIEVRRFALGA
jgi:putative membrane protein